MTAEQPVLTYVFAVRRSGGPEAETALGGLPGVGPPAPVRTLAAGPLTAVVQDVPATDYAEEALRQRLSDRAELERCARAHHEVITAAMAAAPTVPLPLATLYRGDERAREALCERADSLLTALDRITGRVEWGVKVYALTGKTDTPVASPDAAAATGRAYLEQLRSRQRGREERQDAALRSAERVDTVARSLAVAARRLRPHGSEVTGPHRTHVLNAAYLVDGGRERQLRAALASLRRDETAVEIELSGPWAPYSFADGGTAP
ncbi:GvpL/GvpF family gas vesicle protein [Streptomyces sp. NPDC048636]|uniref:GvpL/GvpF family gas vesicle protein n=1 Tax=Streptomyces sp. NPDC048636 TaxID=3155762 RepID=UPI00343D93E7